MDIETVRAFFMWCTIINGGLFVFWFLAIASVPDWVYKTQSQWFPISRDTFTVAIYSFMGLYKLFFLGFNLIPFIALSIVR